MSPYCRRCLGIARAGELRCPLDQEFYQRRDCPACGREVYPREAYCCHCRTSLAGAPETILLPSEAPRLAMAAALGLDLLGGILVVGAQFWSLSVFLALPVGVLFGIVYRSLARAQGRQSLGQAVFHLLSVTRDARPAGYRESAKRTLGEIVLLPLSLFRGPGTLKGLDQFSDCYEIRLV